MVPAFSAKVLGRYDVQYYACSTCSFIQTEKPYWLEAAYSSAITDSDTGIMERNLHNALRLAAVFKLLKLESETVVDVAGGYGILTRLMRDAGFDFRWSDKYCENLLAKGFQASPGLNAAGVCALEVLEHVEDPLGFLRDAITEYGARAVVVSTEEFSSIPALDWWYYSRESGQHISFYSVQSLEALASQLGWFYTAMPRHLHLFTETPVAGVRGAVLKSYLVYVYGLWVLLSRRRYSRTYTDRESLAKEKNGIG